MPLQEENLEMQGNADGSGGGTAAADAAYGTDQGYSENYGAPSMKAATTLNNDNYGAVYQAAGNGSDGGAPVNPFTQQQYQEKPSTNPFAK